ncbi:HEPN domain-containing protein [Vibrio alginolyticus]|uniref:HEPN domain-containing protein n=1 Tax=Vibrio alginolyticus TaxID=663 RepID=UPI0021604FFC|nr:HEPN domain-containing protein [Vibrio alginolyticus]MCS0131058.1 HEPN domain-containing protein [Vibrio alginolyticus]MCS0158580.1 HEPN domain-containing protein [Vibrio alginolyticus]
MKQHEIEQKTYILLNGIEVSSDILLSDSMKLMPADTSHLDFNTALSACSQADDIAVVAAFIPRITAQLEIKAATQKDLAIKAWNSSWDILLLSAIFNSEIGFNLQSSSEASLISEKTNLRATNLYFKGLTQALPYQLSAEDTEWVINHFHDARLLLDNDKFQMAVHCLASYRWHSMPRIQMAVLWAGIEGMFGATSEIRFRISLYIARFLHPNDSDLRKEKFEQVKKLYNSRSSAVHGSKTKGDLAQSVGVSAEILRDLIRQTVLHKALPKENELVP